MSSQSWGLTRRSVVVLLVAAFMVSVLPLRALGGARFTMLSIVPVVAVGLLYGSRQGLLAGVIAYPVNVLLVWGVLGTPMPFLTSMGATVGALFTIAIGWLVGHVASLRHTALGERNLAEALLANAFENAPIGMAIMSPSGDLERVNPSFATMVDRAADDLVGMHWRDITPTREHAHSQGRIAELLTGTLHKTEMEGRFHTGGGEEREGMVHLSVMPGPDGRPTHLLVQMEDITELRRANQQLNDLVTAKDHFIGAVSHELRTPLSAVTGLAHELRDRLEDFTSAEIAEFVEIIAQQSNELGYLVEDFLVHVRADANLITVKQAPVDLVDQAQRVLTSTLAPELADVSVIADDGVVLATADDLRVRQIIRNLLQNAIRYGGPNIQITVQHLDGCAALTVLDDGDGVDEHRHQAIFQPHDSSREPGLTESLGIGLSISRTLARLMSGDITYSRQAGDTHFVLTLPLAELNGEEQHRSSDVALVLR